MSDPYVCSNTTVLKNRFGIKCQDELDSIERYSSTARLAELIEKPIKGNFDLVHLQKIHEHIFQDLYPWAGNIRTVDIAKSTMFCPMQHFHSYQEDVFKKLQKENSLQGLDIDQFSKRAAYYLGEINMLHPFREGNGRTQREFMRELALCAGYDLSFDKVSRQEMIEASIHSASVSNDKFEKLIRDNIVPIKIKIEQKMSLYQEEAKKYEKVTPAVDQEIATKLLLAGYPKKELIVDMKNFSVCADDCSNKAHAYAEKIVNAAERIINVLDKAKNRDKGFER